MTPRERLIAQGLIVPVEKIAIGVTCKKPLERWLHTFVGMMCGRDSTCGTKIDYKSQSGAEKAAMDMGIKVRRKFDVYQCWFCKGWHIGGAYDLTPKKFFRIFWFWLTGRKRKGEKIRNEMYEKGL